VKLRIGRLRSGMNGCRRKRDEPEKRKSVKSPTGKPDVWGTQNSYQDLSSGTAQSRERGLVGNPGAWM